MLPAEPPTPMPEEDSPDLELRPQDKPVTAGPPPDLAGAATAHSEKAGADDVAEYEPL